MGDFPGFFDFTRPGRGDIDDNRYHPFIRFWRRYGRHFTRLLCVNALYALITLPVFVWLMSLINAAAMDMGIGAISVWALCSSPSSSTGPVQVWLHF